MNFLLILEDIKAYWHFFIIGILFVILCVQHARVAYLKIEVSKLELRIDQQNAAVLEWKRESELQAKKMKSAQIEAEKIRKEFARDIKKQLEGKIPEGCYGAIQFGIAAAQKMS